PAIAQDRSGRLHAGRMPRVHGDRVGGAADGEVGNDEDVAGLVETTETRAAAGFVVGERDAVLQEPDPGLGVTAVVEPIQAEGDQFADRVAIDRWTGAAVSGRGVLGREAVEANVLTRGSAGSSCVGPARDVDWVLG